MQAFAGTGCYYWPVPVDESQLRALLVNLCPNYAHMASPMHRACQKGNRFRWTAECEEAFLDIKRKLSNAPILAFPKMGVPFILDSDASDWARGGVVWGSKWEGTYDGIRCTCTFKGWEELQHRPKETTGPWVGNRAVWDIPLWSTFFGHDCL